MYEGMFIKWQTPYMAKETSGRQSAVEGVLECVGGVVGTRTISWDMPCFETLRRDLAHPLVLERGFKSHHSNVYFTCTCTLLKTVLNKIYIILM